ncbi:MAG: hypothetical protein WC096_04320 [Sphaerochaetaceae bacterium]
MNILIRSSGKNTFELISRGQVVLSVREVISKEIDELIATSCRTDNGKCIITFQDGSFLIVTADQKQDLIVLSHTWHYAQKGEWRMYIDLSCPALSDGDALVPCVWYRDNTSGEGCFPSAKKGKRWSFLETRMSMPCSIQLSNGHWALSASLNATEKQETLASVAWGNGTIIYAIPGCEWPFSYQGKKRLEPSSMNISPRCEFGQHQTYTRTVYVRSAQCNGELAAYEQYVRSMEAFSPPPFIPLLSWDAYGVSKLAHLLSLVRKAPNDLAYVSMGEGNGTMQDIYRFTAGSFLVKGVEAAVAFANTRDCDDVHVDMQKERISKLFHIRNDEKLLRRLALKMGRYYLKCEKNGIYQDCVNLQTGEIGGYLGVSEHPEFKTMVNARCTGEAMANYIRLYQALGKLGIVETKFIESPKRVARFFCDCQLSDGSFGRWWTKEKRPGNTKGTNGAYIAMFFTILLPLLDKNDPLYGSVKSSLLQACSFYSEMTDNGEFFGDTLDADACDKEAGVALLSLFLHAYDLFGDGRYLAIAKEAASFILIWVWQQDSFLPPSSPLGKRGFHTQGMTSVSIAHHHLDFYGMEIAVLFHLLAQATNDGFYQRQANLMENACRQLIGTEKDCLGRDPTLFYGWQPEQINHTDWDYFDRPNGGNGCFDIDIAWVNVLGYDNYLILKGMGVLQ